MQTIPYGRQDINQADIDAVVAVLRSDFLTQGPVVPRFEQALAAYCGASHAVAVNSATSALHIACLALGVGPGDMVWTSPVTFVASSNCALYCGAQVDFVDIDPATWNMSVPALEAKLLAAEAAGDLPKVVIPVHLCGNPCDMAAIHALGQRYGFHIIEDASHAVGGRYLGEPIGSCQYSDIAVLSFHPVKIITTAEGGMALTNDPALAQRLTLLRSHGITREVERMTGEVDGPWYYEQQDLGFNYRLTELQAALGLSQMRRLDEFVARRHVLAQRYDELLSAYPLQLPARSPAAHSALHLYVVRLKPGAAAASHLDVFKGLRAAGVGVNLHYMPVYLQPYYRRLGFQPGHCPQAELYYAQAISLPMFSALAEQQLDYVVDTLGDLLGIHTPMAAAH
ncbi:MAG: UDP-4-amino-4,6-dideoxy-N-acetyl-beta-L-altrosamine transaminase [Burkholderiaceae bacterium]